MAGGEGGEEWKRSGEFPGEREGTLNGELDDIQDRLHRAIIRPTRSVTSAMRKPQIARRVPIVKHSDHRLHAHKQRCPLFTLRSRLH